MDDFRFYALWNDISAIKGRSVGDNEKLYAMEPHLRLKKNPAFSGARTRDR